MPKITRGPPTEITGLKPGTEYWLECSVDDDLTNVRATPGSPDDIEITPAMIKAGKDAFSEYWIGIKEGYEEDLEAAVIAIFRRMLLSR